MAIKVKSILQELFCFPLEYSATNTLSAIPSQITSKKDQSYFEFIVRSDDYKEIEEYEDFVNNEAIVLDKHKKVEKS